jgi:hypothetical protein
LLDQSGHPIAKHGVSDCQPLTGDQLDWTVAWADGDNVSALAGQEIRLRIELLNADVFSFQFRE